MSEMTSAQEEAAADAMLDAQIAELYTEHGLPEMSPDLEAAFAPRILVQPVNRPLEDWTPEQDVPPILVEVEE
jgi:hypothetical protein